MESGKIRHPEIDYPFSEFYLSFTIKKILLFYNIKGGTLAKNQACPKL